MKYDNFIDLHPNYIIIYKYINSAYCHNLPRYLEKKEGKFSLLYFCCKSSWINISISSMRYGHLLYFTHQILSWAIKS